MFHREGYKIIINTFLIVSTIAVVAEYYINIEWLKMIIQTAALVLFILVLQFFRNPKRRTPKNEKQLIAPVDGKVVIIQEVFEKEEAMALVKEEVIAGEHTARVKGNVFTLSYLG